MLLMCTADVEDLVDYEIRFRRQNERDLQVKDWIQEEMECIYCALRSFYGRRLHKKGKNYRKGERDQKRFHISATMRCYAQAAIFVLFVRIIPHLL